MNPAVIPEKENVLEYRRREQESKGLWSKLPKKLRDYITAYLFLAPSFIALLLFVFFPLFFSFIMSIYENPEVIELRRAGEFYTDFSNLWWRNIRDFFTADTELDKGILVDPGIRSIFLIVILLVYIFLVYRNINKRTSINKSLIGLIATISGVIAAPLIILAMNSILTSSIIALIAVIIFTIVFFPLFINRFSKSLVKYRRFENLRVIRIITSLFVGGGIIAIITYVVVFSSSFRLPIEEYRVVLTSVQLDFIRILFNTVLWTGVCVFFHVILGIFLALLMNRGFTGQGFFRSIFILPWAIPSFVNALIWRWFVFHRTQGILGQLTAMNTGEEYFFLTTMDVVVIVLTFIIIIVVFLIMNDYISKRLTAEGPSKYIALQLAALLSIVVGMVVITILQTIGNIILSLLPIFSYRMIDIPSISSTFWFTDDIYILDIKLKMVTLSAILVNVWLGVPFMMVSFLAALQSIPRDLYEAADIDGAGSFSKFRNITLPLLKPTLMTVSLLGIIWTFNLFNVVYILTQNVTGLGSSTMYQIFVTFIYERFNEFDYGGSAALSFTVFIILISFSLVYRKVMRAEAIFEGEE
ncbi:MAG: carbohydrate ABC transporter permease [Candidatus Hodarchaeales archaeon]|jgi:ABC-type sugar transport system permease subunit